MKYLKFKINDICSILKTPISIFNQFSLIFSNSSKFNDFDKSQQDLENHNLKLHIENPSASRATSTGDTMAPH